MTAAEWFAQQVLSYKSPTNINGTDYILIPINKVEFLKTKAKQMEKEQVELRYKDGTPMRKYNSPKLQAIEMENNFTPVEWLVKQYEQRFGKESSQAMVREILEALLMEGRAMVKYLNQPELVKVYDPIDPESTIKSDILDAYNAGYEDATCNHINDAEQYYHQKYSHDSSRKSEGASAEVPRP